MPFAANDLFGQAQEAAFLQALQQLGWTDGRNVRIDTRRAAGNAADARPRYAAELFALAPGWGRRGFGAVAAGNQHRADRIRDRPRSSRRRLRR
jgi:hypothetical protein